MSSFSARTRLSAPTFRCLVRARGSTTRSLPGAEFPSRAHGVMRFARARLRAPSLDRGQHNGSHRLFRDDAVVEEGILIRRAAIGERGSEYNVRIFPRLRAFEPSARAAPSAVGVIGESETEELEVSSNAGWGTAPRVHLPIDRKARILLLPHWGAARRSALRTEAVGRVVTTRRPKSV